MAILINDNDLDGSIEKHFVFSIKNNNIESVRRLYEIIKPDPIAEIDYLSLAIQYSSLDIIKIFSVHTYLSNDNMMKIVSRGSISILKYFIEKYNWCDLHIFKFSIKISSSTFINYLLISDGFLERALSLRYTDFATNFATDFSDFVYFDFLTEAVKNGSHNIIVTLVNHGFTTKTDIVSLSEAQHLKTGRAKYMEITKYLMIKGFRQDYFNRDRIPLPEEVLDYFYKYYEDIELDVPAEIRDIIMEYIY